MLFLSSGITEIISVPSLDIFPLKMKPFAQKGSQYTAPEAQTAPLEKLFSRFSPSSL